MLVSFALVKYGSPKVFVANTPKISPSIAINLLNFPNQVALIPVKLKSDYSRFSLNPFAKKQKNIEVFANVRQVEKLPENVILKSIATGVSAAEDTTNGDKYIVVAGGTKYRIVGYVLIGGKKMPKLEFVR